MQEDHESYLGITINHAKDERLTDQSKDLLYKFYLKQGEKIQHGFARACVAWSTFGSIPDLELAQRLYNYCSDGWFGFASPVLSNAPLPGEKLRGLPISCFAGYVPDTIPGLIDHSSEFRHLSVKGGGVGGHWGDVRSVSSVAPGPIPFLRTVDADALAYKQGITRRASYAAYMNINHPDIVEFIQIRVPTGDANRKCLGTGFHNAVNITDEFMNAVENNGMWNLVDPHDGSVRDTIRARELWELLLETRARTGEPYLNFIDTAQRALPEAQRTKGLTLKGSNLCFSGDTLVAVADGRNSVKICDLIDTRFPVYSARKRKYTNQFTTVSGKSWRTEIKWATAYKTGTMPTVNVILEDGSSFKCTANHRLAIHNGDYVEASSAKGVLLEKFTSRKFSKKYRSINANSNVQHRMIWEFHNSKRPKGYHIDHVENDAGDFIENLQILTAEDHFAKSGKERIGQNNPAHLYPQVGNKRRIFKSTRNQNGRWSGYTDCEIIELGRELYEQVGEFSQPTWRKFAKSVNAPQTFSKNRFGGSFDCFMKLVKGEIDYDEPGDLIYPDRNVESIPFVKNIKVVDVIETGEVEDVYDLTVEDNHNFYIITSEDHRDLSGVLVHNCNEIHLPTGIDYHGRNRTFVCCLSSINVEMYHEWKPYIKTFIADLVRMLDNVLQSFIDNAPHELKNAVYSASMERAIGLGTMGVHSLMQREMIAWETDAAVKLDERVHAEIKAAAVEESLNLGKERGVPPDLQGTGMRNSALMALAPTANNASIIGTSPGIELWKANAFAHRTRAGTHLIKNVYLEKVLGTYGKNDEDTWQSVITNNGSVQHLEFLSDEEKNVFKTAIETDQMWVIKHAAARQRHVCQGQSLNLFFPAGVSRSYVNRVHYMAWKLGCKGLYYYRTETRNKADSVSKRIERVALKDGDELKINAERSYKSVEDLSYAAQSDDDCAACQG